MNFEGLQLVKHESFPSLPLPPFAHTHTHTQIYVTTTVAKNFGVTHFLFTISQLPKLVYNKTVGRWGLLVGGTEMLVGGSNCWCSKHKGLIVIDQSPRTCTHTHTSTNREYVVQKVVRPTRRSTICSWLHHITETVSLGQN